VRRISIALIFGFTSVAIGLPLFSAGYAAVAILSPPGPEVSASDLEVLVTAFFALGVLSGWSASKPEEPGSGQG
jgi:hypothetical protein